MAFRTWAQTLGTAAGAAFIAAASQLGVGSGLGLLRWDADFASRAAWHTQLTWLAFIVALATVAGAAAAMWAPAGFTGSTTAQRQPRWARAVLSAAAAVGAAAIIPVATHPAHGVHLPEPGTAGHAATAAMLLGVLVGAALAYLTLTVPAVAGNLVTYAIWLWLAALACALWSLSRAAAPGVEPEPVASSAGKLGLIPPGGGWTATVLLLGIPGVIAFGAASVSRFGGGGRAAVAASGAAGPALVAGAYLIGGRGGGTQTVAFWCALGGVAVGAAVSAFVALARRIPRPDFLRPAYQRSDGPRPEYAGHRYDLDEYDDEPGGARHGGGEHAQPWDRDDPWDRDSSADDAPATWRPRGYSEPPDRLTDALRSPTDDHDTGAAESTGRGGRRSDNETTGSHRLPDWSSFDAASLSAESTSAVNTSAVNTTAVNSVGVGAGSDTSSGNSAGSHTGEWRMPADEPAPVVSRWPDPVDTQPEPEPVPLARAAVEDLWSTPAAAEPVSSVWTPTPAPVEAAAPVATTPAVPAQPSRWEPASFTTPSFPTPSGPTPTSSSSYPASTSSFPTSSESSFGAPAAPAPGRTGRDRSSSIFDSPPAPEVPSAPSSRSRSSSIFDAPPPPEAPPLRPGVVRRDRDDSRRPPVIPDPFDDLDAPYDTASYDTAPYDAEPAVPEPVSPAPPAGNLPAWAEHLSGDYPVAEPAPAPTGKAGKRGRRKGEQQEAPVVHAKDAEYVDWFKDLRGSGRSAEKS